jgi:dihydrofolate reductase
MLDEGDPVKRRLHTPHEAADLLVEGVFGSGQIVQQLAQAGLMDEFILCVSPVALGAGVSLFDGVNRLTLTLVELRQFDSGNLIVRYQTRLSPSD